MDRDLRGFGSLTIPLPPAALLGQALRINSAAAGASPLLLPKGLDLLTPHMTINLKPSPLCFWPSSNKPLAPEKCFHAGRTLGGLRTGPVRWLSWPLPGSDHTQMHLFKACLPRGSFPKWQRVRSSPRRTRVADRTSNLGWGFLFKRAFSLNPQTATWRLTVP